MGDVIPCPRCGLLATLLPAIPGSGLARARCPEGHEHTLAPTVLDHLLDSLPGRLAV